METEQKQEIQRLDSSLQDPDVVEWTRKSVLRIIKNIFSEGWAIFLQEFFKYGNQLLFFGMAAILDDKTFIAGLSLGYSTYLLLTMPLVHFLNQEFSLKGYQTIHLEGNMTQGGVYLNVARIYNILIAVLIILIFSYSENIFLLMNQDPTVSYRASLLLRGMVPGMVFLSMASLHMMYLNIFGKMKYGTLGALTGLVILTAITVPLIFFTDLGLFAAGIAESVSQLFQYMLLTYLLYQLNEIKPALVGIQLNREFWEQTKSVLYLVFSKGIPNFLIILTFEIMQPLSGLFGADHNAAQGVLANIYTGFLVLTFMVQIGQMFLIQKVFMNMNVDYAKFIAKVSLLFVIFQLAFQLVVLWFIRINVVVTQISDSTVDEIVFSLYKYAIPSLITDSLGLVALGPLRGMGKESLALSIQAIFFFVQTFLGCFFAFYVEMGHEGLWLGYLIGSGIFAIVINIILWKKLDWNEICIEMLKKYATLATHNNHVDIGGIDEGYGAINHDDQVDQIKTDDIQN